MKELDWTLLQSLCAIHAVSGREDLITAYLRDMIRPLVDEVSVDNLGNVVGILKGGKYPEHRLMLQAHMDELGLIVRNITDDGFLRVERVGGMPEKSLLGQRMDILTDEGKLIPGYVGAKSHHITTPEEKYKVPSVHDMFIDVGSTSREAVGQSGIQVGDPVTYHPNYHRFGDGLICSKALDNRVSVFILLEVLKSLSIRRPPCTLVFSFTVLEEFSIRGSLPTVTATKPHAILSLDITIATDTPMDKPLHPVAIRKGPAIKMMDFHGRGTLGGLFSSPKLRKFIEKIAARELIPLQREVIVGVITDPAFQLYLDDKGYVIAGISIPHRYSHASIQMCHETDIAQTVHLVESIAQSFTPDVDLSRG
ncbi:MAG: M42 family metallopeptidase [Chloroflexi bacterium]|nr:M42 family metallopeptidase [Chloroflexota bacterium]